MNAQGAAPTFSEHRKISAGLRGLDHTERIFLSGDSKVGSVVTRDLQEDAAVGSAFVGLSCRVQEARAKAEACGDFLLITHRRADPLQRRFVFGVHGDVAKYGEVVPGTNSREMGLQNIRKRFAAGEQRGVFVVSEKFGVLCG